MKKLNEMILKEDLDSFKAKSLEQIENDIDPDTTYGQIERYYKTKDNFFKILYNIVYNNDNINRERVINIIIENGNLYSLRLFLSYLEVYNKLSKMNVGQYGIKLIKINNSEKSVETINSYMNLKDYLLKVLDKIKEIKETRKAKKEGKSFRSADVLLYDDDDVEISLFTKFKTSKLKFGGITNWCTTKQSFRWNEYNRNGFLVLFNNKKVKYKSMGTTPEAYFCNQYIVINDNELDEAKTWNMPNDNLKHPNFTTEYHEIVEEKCKEYFGGSLLNFRDKIEVVGENDSDDDNPFLNALSTALIGNKVIADEFAKLGNENYIFNEFEDDDLSKLEEETRLMNNAEFHGNLFLTNIILKDETEFPKIGYIEYKVTVINFGGNIEFADNKLTHLQILNRDIKSSYHFETELNLKIVKIISSYETIVSCEEEIKIDKLEIADSIIIFRNVEISKFSWFGVNDMSEIEFHSEDGGELSFEVYMDIPTLVITGFEKVYITIKDDLDISEELRFDKNVEEIHFIFNGDVDSSDIKNLIADGTIDIKNDNATVYYEEQ